MGFNWAFKGLIVKDLKFAYELYLWVLYDSKSKLHFLRNFFVIKGWRFFTV